MTTDQVFKDPKIQSATTLRNLYITRAAFSICWIVLVLTVADQNQVLGNVLFIIYPAWDILATIYDISVNPVKTNRRTQWLNVVISTATTIAVILALQKGYTQAFYVFGSWAILTGGIQFILALRRRDLGGQWPLIISGAQSMIAGIAIGIKANTPGQGVAALAGYAAFGAFYFLLGAYFISRTIKKQRISSELTTIAN